MPLVYDNSTKEIFIGFYLDSFGWWQGTFLFFFFFFFHQCDGKEKSKQAAGQSCWTFHCKRTEVWGHKKMIQECEKGRQAEKLRLIEKLL